MSDITFESLDVVIDGAALLDELHELLGTYVVFPSVEAHDSVTLWIAATHAQAAFEAAPRLAVVSPDKRCGKSRLLDLVEAASHRSFITVNASVAAVTRSINADDPLTIIIDEADTIFAKGRTSEGSEELRGIINAGFQRNRTYRRFNMNLQQVEEYETFSMAALASIGNLPDTIMDRAVVVRMRRRANDERVDPYRTRRDGPNAHDLRRRLNEWIRPNLAELADSEPIMPVEDRAADTWEPLIAIADLAGDSWPLRSRSACTFMVQQVDDSEESIGTRLLKDIQQVLAAGQHGDFIASKQLAIELTRLDESPWDELNLNPHGLANRLRTYGIKPRHNHAKTQRGYAVRDFEDAFIRYLPVETVPASEPSDELSKLLDEEAGTERPDREPGKTHDADDWTLQDDDVVPL